MPNPNGNGNSNGGPADDAPVFTEARAAAVDVNLPPNVRIDVNGLLVGTPGGQTAVSGGRAEFDVFSDFPSFVQVFGADGRAVLAGFVTPGEKSAPLDVRSSAAAALYFAIGGFALPANRTAAAVELLRDSPECERLSAALATAMQSNPAAFGDGDPAVEAALRDSLASLLARARTDAAVAQLRGLGQTSISSKSVARSQLSDGFVLLSPEASVQLSGAQVLQNDAGAGILVQNNYRRRCILLPYYVGSENAEGIRTDEAPELSGGGLNVPGSARLSPILALGSLTGATPWAPVRSEATPLPRPTDAPKHFYKLVLLGPSLTGGGIPPSLNTPEFAALQPDWDARMRSLQFEMFVFDFFLPTLEFLLLGTASNIGVDGRVATLELWREAMEPTLVARGFPLASATTSEYLRGAVIASLGELRENPNGFFSRNVLQTFIRSVPQALRNRATLEALQASVQRALAARTILLSVELAFGGADLLAVMRDLTSASAIETWDATVIERRVRLTPQIATLNGNDPTEVFEASVVGRANEAFLYRWTTTGRNGVLFDELGGEGATLETSDKRVQYVANAGIGFTGELDTVTVEVFESTSIGVIPPGAIPIGVATATVRGGTSADPGNGDGCGPGNIVTRPDTGLFSITIPRSVRLGSRMEVVVTINGPEIERLITGGRQCQVVGDIVCVSGAIDFIRNQNYDEILIDGVPAFSASDTRSTVGNRVSTYGDDVTHAGMRMDVIPLTFDTRTRLTRALSVPIDTLYPCDGTKGYFVRVLIEPSCGPNFPTLEQQLAFEQFFVSQ
ncbi:MAG: hypothetical protein SF069_15380 [Phycisphaerae bacterium]|nr:hypothetical protein [Phycisphaerae bacterium]